MLRQEVFHGDTDDRVAGHKFKNSAFERRHSLPDPGISRKPNAFLGDAQCIAIQSGVHIFVMVNRCGIASVGEVSKFNPQGQVCDGEAPRSHGFVDITGKAVATFKQGDIDQPNIIAQRYQFQRQDIEPSSF